MSGLQGSTKEAQRGDNNVRHSGDKADKSHALIRSYNIDSLTLRLFAAQQMWGITDVHDSLESKVLEVAINLNFAQVSGQRPSHLQ